MEKKLSLITPGDVLIEEFLRPMGISQNQLAKDINVSANFDKEKILGATTNANFLVKSQREESRFVGMAPSS